MKNAHTLWSIPPFELRRARVYIDAEISRILNYQIIPKDVLYNRLSLVLKMDKYNTNKLNTLQEHRDIYAAAVKIRKELKNV